MNCQRKRKYFFPLLLQNGMLISTSRLMMMFMSIWVLSTTFSISSLIMFIYIYVLNIALLKCCSIFSYRNASSNSCTPPIKTPCLHWVYEIWTCSFPKVNQISVLVFFIVSFPPLFDGDEKHFLICLISRNVKYHEPEYWKFGEDGNKYFRHATGQIYAISKDLATYISINR